MKRVLQLLIGALLLNLWGCNYTHVKSPLKFIGTPDSNSKLDSKPPGFSEIKSAILDPYCLSCHRSGKWALLNYEQTFRRRYQIYESVFKQLRMPPNRTLPQDRLLLLKYWLDSGAPEEGRPLKAKPVVLDPSYRSLREGVFERHCSECHDPQSSICQKKRLGLEMDQESQSKAEGCQLDLFNYQELLFGAEESNKELIIPGEPDMSQLVISIERTDGKDEMPPPEFGYQPLSLEEKKVLRDWIELGAPNN